MKVCHDREIEQISINLLPVAALIILDEKGQPDVTEMFRG